MTDTRGTRDRAPSFDVSLGKEKGNGAKSTAPSNRQPRICIERLKFRVLADAPLTVSLRRSWEVASGPLWESFATLYLPRSWPARERLLPAPWFIVLPSLLLVMPPSFRERGLMMGLFTIRGGSR